MRLRDFLIQIGAAVAWPLAAQAQEAGRTYRVGALLRAKTSQSIGAPMGRAPT
jgi:hypothetical protein